LGPFRFVLVGIAGWVNQCQLQVIDYLREENRVLRDQRCGWASAKKCTTAVRMVLRFLIAGGCHPEGNLRGSWNLLEANAEQGAFRAEPPDLGYRQ